MRVLINYRVPAVKDYGVFFYSSILCFSENEMEDSCSGGLGDELWVLNLPTFIYLCLLYPCYHQKKKKTRKKDKKLVGRCCPTRLKEKW